MSESIKNQKEINKIAKMSSILDVAVNNKKNKDNSGANNLLFNVFRKLTTGERKSICIKMKHFRKLMENPTIKDIISLEEGTPLVDDERHVFLSGLSFNDSAIGAEFRGQIKLNNIQFSMYYGKSYIFDTSSNVEVELLIDISGYLNSLDCANIIIDQEYFLIVYVIRIVGTNLYLSGYQAEDENTLQYKFSSFQGDALMFNDTDLSNFEFISNTLSDYYEHRYGRYVEFEAYGRPSVNIQKVHLDLRGKK